VIVLYVLKYIPHPSVTPLFVIPARNIRRRELCSLFFDAKSGCSFFGCHFSW